MTETFADVAVVVVNYGSGHLLRENLAPLSRSAPGLKVVVVDNRTSDDERALVSSLAETEGWSTVLPSRNTGFGGGMNLGAREAVAAGARFLLLLNPDAIIDRDALATLVTACRREPRALLSPRILRPDGSVWFDGSDLSLDDGRIRSRRRREVASAARIEEWLTGACLLLSADLFISVGGFDESYFLYWEDVDLSRRVREAGGSLRVVPEAEAIHAEGGTQSSGGLVASGQAKSAVYYRFNIRNRLLFAAKHLDDADLARWKREAPRVAREILLQGGRRQFVRSPGTLVVGLRALAEGRRIATTEQRRRAGGRA